MREGLAHERISLDESDGEVCGPLAIMVFAKASTELLAWVQAATARRASPLVAIAAPGVSLDDEDAWRLLDAGAADVFAWDQVPQPARLLREKVERAAALDELMASPLVAENLIGASAIWHKTLRQVLEVAVYSDASVLLTGETGTGKEMIARLIHTLDRRARKRDLIVLDCTTVVSDLSGSEFFGHEKGAYTGAAANREGAFALADEGTLFLDEVGELPLRLQAELLRAVQERTYKRVGGNTWERSDFRLICATHRDLAHEQREGRFRKDFFFRIASTCCHLPSLDQRRPDILPLAQHFVKAMRPKQELTLDRPVQRHLLRRSYPGNVRELRQLITRIVHRHVGDGPITLGDLPAEERAQAARAEAASESLFDDAVDRALAFGMGLKEIGRQAEDAAVRLAVGAAAGNLQVAARALGVSDRALQLRRAQRAEVEPAA